LCNFFKDRPQVDAFAVLAFQELDWESEANMILGAPCHGR
jgi:hypothetical protein